MGELSNPWDLTYLSTKGETSNTDPATVSTGEEEGDYGGVSYGAFQLSSRFGIPGDFIKMLKENGYKYANAFDNAGEEGSPQFSNVWRWVASQDPEGFYKMQADFAKKSYFDKAREKLLEERGFDAGQRSLALNQVLFSRAVHHDSSKMPKLFVQAAESAGKELKDMSDEELIHHIYHVEKIDPSWTEGSPTQRVGLHDRFDKERDMALALLAKERENEARIRDGATNSTYLDRQEYIGKRAAESGSVAPKNLVDQQANFQDVAANRGDATYVPHEGPTALEQFVENLTNKIWPWR